MTGIHRRDALKLGLGTLAYTQFELFRTLVDATLAELLGSSTARAATGDPFNYLLFLHPGAPPRWCTDAFLSPNLPIVDGQANAEYIPHPVVRNVAKDAGNYTTTISSDNTKTTYETTSNPFLYKDRNDQTQQIYLPKVWDATMPEWNGSGAVYGTRKLSDLLNQTMLIRGYSLQADFGHVKGPALQAQPILSAPSISGLVADRAFEGSDKRQLPAVALTDSPSRPLGFRSRGAGLTLGNAEGASNRASDLLACFLRAGLGSTHAGNKALVRAAVDAALAAYRAESVATDPNAAALFSNASAVDSLVTKLSSIDIAAEYTALKNKYAALVRYSCVALPGLVGDLKLTTNAGGVITGVPYMTDSYSDKFAVAELFIKHGLTASFTFICGGSSVPGSYATLSNNPHGAMNDEHAVVDRMYSLFAHNWKYRAWMACVDELAKAIGPERWAKTVVQFGAEYARSPNSGSGGSDHAINACSTTLISGALTSFIPIGNVARSAVTDPTHNNYGTYGVGAPTDIEGVGAIKIPNEFVANTVMTLMGIESPFRDKTTLIKQVAGKWLPKTEGPKNV